MKFINYHGLTLFSSLIFCLICSVEARIDDPCASAPLEMKHHCHQLYKWDNKVREKKKTARLPPGMADLGKGAAADFAQIPSEIYQCMDLNCVCNYIDESRTAPDGSCRLSNGQQLRKAYRREIRQLSEDERQRLYKAMWEVKESGEYSRFVQNHKSGEMSASAHSGPAFLPWHREYIKRMEFAIRQVDPTLSLPYLDWTLDAALKTPKDTVLFTKYLMGETQSDNSQWLINGPFVQWSSIEGNPSINRSVGTYAPPPHVSVPMTTPDVEWFMNRTNIDEILSFTSPKAGCPFKLEWNVIEYTHGKAHMFVGGDMSELVTASNDPIFFFQHSFVDLVWEEWRQKHQTRGQREIEYPADDDRCSAAQHFAGATMYPFIPLVNRDGLSNKYTDLLYSYAPRPTCSRSNPNGCNSEFLFCVLSDGPPHCSSKMKAGAKKCDFYKQGENPCYKGVCRNGVCVETQAGSTPSSTARPAVTSKPITTTQTLCYNENKCCATWAAKGECSNNREYMHDMCRPSCGQCTVAGYRLVDDCTDRHKQCSAWAKTKECETNKDWMEENCRRSCNKCSMTRAQECSPGAQAKAKAAIAEEEKCDASEGCHNENACCSYWALRGECRSNPKWMACNCQVSCGFCAPTTYSYGSCVDYNRHCRPWSKLGECSKNPWMPENCRYSCNSCFTQWKLDEICRGKSGTVAPLTKSRFVATPLPRRRLNNWRRGK